MDLKIIFRILNAIMDAKKRISVVYAYPVPNIMTIFTGTAPFVSIQEITVTLWSASKTVLSQILAGCVTLVQNSLKVTESRVKILECIVT